MEWYEKDGEGERERKEKERKREKKEERESFVSDSLLPSNEIHVRFILSLPPSH